MSTATVPLSARITGIAPQLLVENLDRAISYYCDKLGFRVDFTYQSFYASVSRDGFAIHLKCAPKLAAEREHRKRNEHLDAYVSVENVRKLFGEFEKRGAQVLKPVQQQPWGTVDFYIEDPDGHILCFSEPSV